ncbi:RNA polymerase sigma factor [Streptomyces sp. NPDC056503]|uniref:RNA polymerase sigma factor n=1 Tax=Streptomyces sp. NPDC056503 TaxID=3345842 RepID=UPI003699B087
MPDPDDTPFADRLLGVHHEKEKTLLRLARRELRSESLPSSRTEAEDIVQDALVTLLVNSEKREIGDLYGYLCAVIRNRVRDVSRRRAAEPIDTTSSTSEGHKALWVSDLEEDTDAVLDAERALGKLSAQQRRLILLSEGWNYTHAEIARITGVHRGTVATHIRRAKAALAASLVAVIAAFIGWAPEITARLQWIDAASERWLEALSPESPTLAVSVASVSLGVVYRYFRNRPVSPELARATQVLHAMIEASPELSDGRDLPTPSDYAAHLGVPEEWITLETLRTGRLSASVGTRILVNCAFDTQTVNAVIARRGENEIVSGTRTYLPPRRHSGPPDPGGGYLPGGGIEAPL